MGEWLALFDDEADVLVVRGRGAFEGAAFLFVEGRCGEGAAATAAGAKVGEALAVTGLAVTIRGRSRALGVV